MKRKVMWWTRATCAGVLCAMACTAYAAEHREMNVTVTSDRKVSGFVHPESVAFDPDEKVLYVSEFGSVLRPTLKDGKGRISKVSLEGRVIEKHCLPIGHDILHKPKGIWIEGDRLWVTDIDAVWIFDLDTRRGKKVILPDALFANDPTVMKDSLYVSDSTKKCIYRITPADFLSENVSPHVAIYGTTLSFGPNGLFPAADGDTLLVAGYSTEEQEYGVYAIESCESLSTVVRNLGMLDGLVQLDDGSIMVTDWKSQSLILWHRKGGLKTLATDFRGPADFCVVPDKGGLLVVVPDLVVGDLRFIRLEIKGSSPD